MARSAFDTRLTDTQQHRNGHADKQWNDIVPGEARVIQKAQCRSLWQASIASTARVDQSFSLMSAPTEGFQRLTIGGGNMPTTRAQAKQQLHRRPDEDEEDDEEEDVESSEDESESEGEPEDARRSPESFTHGQAGTYDNRRLSPDSWKRAKEGLAENFTIELCSEITPAQPKTYYAFQLTPRTSPHAGQPSTSRAETDNIVIRIGASDSQYKTPTCSCRDFETRRTACKHVFWLLDKIIDYSPSDRIGDTLPLWKDGSALHGSTPFDQIRKRTLPSIAAGHRAPYRRRSDVQSEVGDDETSFSRKDQVRDILSVFDKKTLPEDYLTTTYKESSEESLSSQPLMIPSSLESTIFRIAVQDIALFSALRNAVHPDYCASVFFDKVLGKARDVIRRLDAYVEQGPVEGSERFDVAWCANNLRELVNLVRHNLELRAPLGRATKTKAFRILVTILQEVTQRNRDVYANITWARIPASDEKDIDRNLYARLIGNAARVSKAEVSALKYAEKDRGNFVIDALRDLTDVGRDESLQLPEILRAIEENDAPPGYIAEFRRLFEQFSGRLDVGASSSAGQKRGGVGDNRGPSKRMK